MPKALRDQLGLTPRSELILEVQGSSLVLRPVTGAVVESDGLLVATGELDGGALPDHRSVREVRIRSLVGS